MHPTLQKVITQCVNTEGSENQVDELLKEFFDTFETPPEVTDEVWLSIPSDHRAAILALVLKGQAAFVKEERAARIIRIIRTN